MPGRMHVMRRLKNNTFNTKVLNTSCLSTCAERPDLATRSRKRDGKKAHGRLEPFQAALLACIVTEDRVLLGAWSTLWHSQPRTLPSDRDPRSAPRWGSRQRDLVAWGIVAPLKCPIFGTKLLKESNRLCRCVW
jgi:hypothetical protein